jgi:hypothetical protein
MGDPPSWSVRDTTRVYQLLDVTRRQAVDQPTLEHRIGERNSLLDELLS